MASTSIEWTATVNPDGSVSPGKVWNPVVGCTRVSAGCEHCYAERLAHRLARMGQAQYAGLTRKLPNGEVRWTGKAVCLPERLAQPLQWRKPQRIFVNSMSDLFHEDVPDEFLTLVFRTMLRAHWHTFQVLTKRPERMQSWVNNWRYALARWEMPPNVWLGVSVEDQRSADERIPLLLQTPAAVRFLSCEPLLGSINLDCFLWKRLPIDKWPTAALESGARECVQRTRTLHWVIAGGESGPGYRPMDLAWIRSLRDQCKAASVPFFAKQNSGPRTHMWLPEDLQSHEFPETTRVEAHV